MCVLSFCTTFVWNIFHSKKNWARYDQTFYVHESVRRDTIMKFTNKMQMYRSIYYAKSALHVSGRCFRPSSGALDCIYSIR